MARKAIEIVSDAKRKINKDRQRGDFRPAPFFDAQAAAGLCDPNQLRRQHQIRMDKEIGNRRRVHPLRNRNNTSH